MVHVRRFLVVALAAALAACGGPSPTPPTPDPDPVPPEISGVAPTVAPRGATIVISGADFGADGSVTIGGVAAAITSWTEDEIQAVVAAGTPNAWQEVEVTTDEGSDAFSPFFVGSAFTGTAAALQDFLADQPAGTAVLLEAAVYDLSALPDELLIDNRSLYGRGEAATSLLAPTGAVVLADFDAAVTVADLTLQTDELIYFHGTLAGTLATASVSSWKSAQDVLAFGTRTIELPQVASPLSRAAHAPPSLTAPLAAFEANGVTVPSLPLASDLPLATEFVATAFDVMPEVTVTPAGVAYPRITFANVTFVEDAGGGFFGFPLVLVPAVELTLTEVTVDGPNTATFLYASQDVIVADTDVTAGLITLISINGAVSVASSSLVSASDVALYAESGLSVNASTVRAEDGDIEIVGAVLGLLVGTGLPAGGPVTITESTVEALDADLADGSDVGALLVTTQFAPIVLRDNVLIRSHLDTLVLNEASFLGEGAVTLAGNAAVRVGVSQADEPVDFRQSELWIQTGLANVPGALTLDGNAIDITGVGLFLAGDTEPGNLVARDNVISVGDGFDSGVLVLVSGIPGTITMDANQIASDGALLVVAQDLDGGSLSLDGNAIAVVGDNGPVMQLVAQGGSCTLNGNEVTVDDVGADNASFLYLLCIGVDPAEDAFAIEGNELSATGNGGSVIYTVFANGPLSATANEVTGEAQLYMEIPNSAATIANNTVALGANAFGWILVGDADTDVTVSGNVVDYVDVGAYGLGLQGIGNAELAGNQVASTGAPAPDAIALAVLTAGGGTPVAVTASGNTFTNFSRALYFGDQAGAAIGIDATVSGNVFGFVIDAAPKVAELFNVADEIDARNNQWGTNTVLATVASYVTLSGDTAGQGGSILLDPITQP